MKMKLIFSSKKILFKKKLAKNIGRKNLVRKTFLVKKNYIGPKTFWSKIFLYYFSKPIFLFFHQNPT